MKKPSEVIKGYIDTFDEPDKSKIMEAKHVIETIVNLFGNAGRCALALLGAELAEEDGPLDRR